MEILGTSRFDSIDDLLNKFHDGAATGNLESYFGCFHPRGSFLGTDVTENWLATDFSTFCRPHFARGGWEYTPIPRTRKINFFSESEALSTLASFDEQIRSKDFKVVCRGTGSLVKSAEGHWLIFAYHLSFNVPNEIAGELCARIQKHESKADLASRSAAADAAAAELLEELNLGSGSKSKGKKGKKGK